MYKNGTPSLFVEMQIYFSNVCSPSPFSSTLFIANNINPIGYETRWKDAHTYSTLTYVLFTWVNCFGHKKFIFVQMIKTDSSRIAKH